MLQKNNLFDHCKILFVLFEGSFENQCLLFAVLHLIFDRSNQMLLPTLYELDTTSICAPFHKRCQPDNNLLTTLPPPIQQHMSPLYREDPVQLQYEEVEISVEYERQIAKHVVVQLAYLLLKGLVDCIDVYFSVGLAILYLQCLFFDEDKLIRLDTLMQLLY